MADRSLICVVDDDASIRDALHSYLSRHGFAVSTASGGEGLDAQLAAQVPDLVILDVMMPGEGGLDICRRLAERRIPVLMLSALDDVMDRVVGLELGAADYLGKPFDPRELLARVRGLLRRTGPGAERTGVSRTFAGWTLDLERREVRTPDGESVNLTAGELGLLDLLSRRPGVPVSRDSLLTAGHGDRSDAFDRAVDLAISRLRRKLAEAGGHDLIETVRGLGYRLRANAIP